MRFHQPLGDLLDSGPKLRLLRFLCRKGGEWSGRRLAAELGLNPWTAHRALRALHHATVLDRRRVGRSDCYSIRDEHDLVREALRPLFAAEAGAMKRLQRRLERTLRSRQRLSVVTVALYGSVAAGRERPTSDLDCLVIVASPSARPRVRRILETEWQPIERVFGNPLALYVKTVGEMRRMVRQQTPLWHNILQESLVLWGQPLAKVLDGRAA